MLPDLVLSDVPVPAPYLDPDDHVKLLTTDYEKGGIALRDPSQGLLVQDWTFELIGDDVTVRAPAVAKTTLFTLAGITEIAGCFDQNMNPCVGFVAAGNMTLWYFDTITHVQIFVNFAGNSPKVCMDDKRANQGAANDIIFAYLRGNNLYFRAQRDRFMVEYFLHPIDVTMFNFVRMGMNTVLRVQFEFDPIPGAGI